jgi:DNA-binding MarR family transcriptional regulator
MDTEPMRNVDNVRLSHVLEETMVQFPIVARKILIATKAKKSPVSSGMLYRLLEGLIQGPMKPSDISQVHCISKPNVTTLINKLIDDGFAQRSHDEKDRRVIYVTITEKGRKTLQRYRIRVKRYLLKVFEQLSAKELEDILTGMEKFQYVLTKLNNVI